MAEFELVKETNIGNLNIQINKSYSAMTKNYIYAVEMYNNIVCKHLIECKMYKTLNGAENRYNGLINTHTTN